MAHRPAPGARRAVPLGEGPAWGWYVDPDTLRGMLEWDGHQWIPSGVADDHAAAVAEPGPQVAAERPMRKALPAVPRALDESARRPRSATVGSHPREWFWPAWRLARARGARMWIAQVRTLRVRGFHGAPVGARGRAETA
ncbi:DUF6087 family protein [Streptomyces sp. NPDC057543]|uniref:DUF6087 family protein n=1 Tax=Streptomyces sp. NPDC057543 TaxID=3346163 RepID=UPI0036A7695A